MTKEERTQHAQKISNDYVARISPNETEAMEEVRKLPIQDIITIYSNACYALEQGIFVGVNEKALEAGEEKAKRFLDAIEHVKQIVIERLKTADMLWTITDSITKSPFIDDVNNVWVFTEKEYADECVDYYMQQLRTTWAVTEIPKDEVIKFFGLTAYTKGAECFYVDYGAYAAIKLRAEWIIEKPDCTGVPMINQPVMNPVFFRSVAKLNEERMYRADYRGKAEKLKAFEDDMIKAFHDAKFLVPVKGMDQLVKNTQSKDTKRDDPPQKSAEIRIPVLSRDEGESRINFTPVFTDWEEFNKIYSQDEWGGWIWTAENLATAPDELIVVNPASLDFEMSKKMIGQMLDIYEKEFTRQVLPDTLMEFMECPMSVTRKEFLEKYGNEKVFKLAGYSEKKEKWTLCHSPKHKGVFSEGVYFTYEDALTALMMRNVDCPINKWVPRQMTVSQVFENGWTLRFIRDGKVLVVKQKDDEFTTITGYTQKDLLDKLVSEHEGKTVIAEDLYKDMQGLYLDDIVLWVLARPDLTKETGKWSFRKSYKYKKESPYKDEFCYHVFSTYEAAAKEAETGYYPQKTTLYQELADYTDKPHILYCGESEVMFVPKKMYREEPATNRTLDKSELPTDFRPYVKEPPAGKTGGPEAVASALNAIQKKEKKKEEKPVRDPFAERQKEEKMSPEDIKEYNAVQKKMGGIPLDPYGSRRVCDAIEACIAAAKNRGKNDPDYIQGVISYTMRENGPWEELSGEERQRVVRVVTEYFKE